MQPENNLNNLNAEALEPTQEFAPVTGQGPVQPEPVIVREEASDIVIGPEKPKKNLGSLILMIVLAILAVAGVTFGIIMAMNGNKGGSSTTVGAFENPVIKDATGVATWSEYYESSRLYVNGTKTVGITVQNGEVNSCEIQGLIETPTEDGKGTMIEGGVVDCIVSGLTKDIYKVVEFGKGISPEDFNLGFIMTDGTMYYIKTVNAIENDNFAVRPVNVDGYVVDAIKIDIEPTEENPGGELSSVLVLQDGSVVEFENSMLK